MGIGLYVFLPENNKNQCDINPIGKFFFLNLQLDYVCGGSSFKVHQEKRLGHFWPLLQGGGDFITMKDLILVFSKTK